MPEVPEAQKVTYVSVRFVKVYTKVRYLCLICCGYQVRVKAISIIYKGIRENLWNNGMV